MTENKKEDKGPNPIIKWFMMLIGKGSQVSTQASGENTQKSVPQEKTEKEVVTKKTTPDDDAVQQDIVNAKKFFRKLSGDLSVKVAPSVEKTKKGSQKFGDVIKSAVDFRFVRISLKVFITLLFILIFVYILVRVYYLLRYIPEDDVDIVYPTPTTQVYKPTEPSVYADDEYILKLEEELKVLRAEISGINVREVRLNPPRIDLDIQFK